MPLELTALSMTLALFALMVGAIEVGRMLGRRRLGERGEGLAKGIGAAEGAVFALLGLLIAFTFSGAASRFEARRALVTAEANAIGTAWLRLDLLPVAARPELRELFRRYLDQRLITYRHVEQREVALRDLDESNLLQERIWARSRAALLEPGVAPNAGELVVPALNEMFDITTTRTAETSNHPPPAIFALLFVLCVMASLLVGYSMAENRSRRWLHALSFALIMALSIYMILDLEYPRLGIIRIDDADQVLIALRASMN